MAQNPNFIQATMFPIKRFFTTISSARNSLKQSAFISYHSFVVECMIAEESKGLFNNIFPFLSHQGSCKTVNITTDKPVEGKSSSKLLLSLGHNFPIDPGAVGFTQGKVFREVEAVAHQLDSIISVMDSNSSKTTIDVLPWNALKDNIRLINDISRSRRTQKLKDQVHLSLHSDFAVSDINSRPLTFGVYYGSNAGKKHSQFLVDHFALYMKLHHPGVTFRTWVRPDTASPLGRLAVIRDTIPVSLIIESDFMSRHFDDLKITQNAIAHSILALDSSL